jgi:hypothetical protein
MLVRTVLFLAVATLALAAWDALENDGAWGREAGHSVERVIDDALRVAHLS